VTWEGDKVKEHIASRLHSAMRESVLLVEGAAKKLDPVDTGQLRSSIASHIEGGSKSSQIEGVVYSNAEYAPHVEFGTEPHKKAVGSDEFITSVTDWCRRHGIKDPYPIIRKIRRSGTKAQPFLIPALHQNQNRIQAIFNARMAV